VSGVSRRHGRTLKARDTLHEFVTSWTRAGGAPADLAQERVDELLAEFEFEVRYATVHIIREHVLGALIAHQHDHLTEGLEHVVSRLRHLLEAEDRHHDGST
jgi:hypothetical protein